MTIINLYTGAGVTFSPEQRDNMQLSSFVRIVADEGRILTNGTIKTECRDVLRTEINNWTEISGSIEEDIDDTEAFDIIFGGAE